MPLGNRIEIGEVLVDVNDEPQSPRSGSIMVLGCERIRLSDGSQLVEVTPQCLPLCIRAPHTAATLLPPIWTYLVTQGPHVRLCFWHF